MKYADARLRQMLSAEYVLGTLRGRARSRFERLLREQPAIGADVQYWERRLAGFALGLKPQLPPERVWAAIDQRINSGKVTSLPVPGRSAAVRPAINLWRVWAVAATLGCVALGYQVQQLIGAGPQFVEVPKIVTVLQPMPYVAVLQPGGDVKFVLALSPEKGQIKVAVSGNKPPVDYTRRSLELWLLDEGGTPHSLGVMPETGEAQLPMPKNMSVPAQPTLAISDEPRGGSPTGLPTGPVLTAGPAIRAL